MSRDVSKWRYAGLKIRRDARWGHGHISGSTGAASHHADDATAVKVVFDFGVTCQQGSVTVGKAEEMQGVSACWREAGWSWALEAGHTRAGDVEMTVDVEMDADPAPEPYVL